MYILGIVEGHNCSAALMKDGEIVAVCFEERLSRLKNDLGYPRRAIESCLDQEGIRSDQIDHVAMVTKNLPLGQVAVKREATFSVEDHIREQEEYWKPRLIDGLDPDYFSIFHDKLRLNELSYDFIDLKTDRSSFANFLEIRKNTIKRHLSVKDTQIHCMEHHLAHSMYAVFSNPACYEKDWLVLVADGYGDDCSASVGVWKNGKFDFIAKSPGSGIGRIYRYATLLLNMRPGVDEHKVMGLASYAKEPYCSKAKASFAPYLKVNGLVIDYTNQDKDIYFSLKERLKAARFDGIAGGLQMFAEEISVEWTRNAVRATGIPNIAFSGGVAMNIKVNMAMMELDEVSDLFVGPSGGDESLSLGAAYALWHEKFNHIGPVKPLSHAYLGPSYSATDAERALADTLPAGYNVIQNPSLELLARCLAEGRVLARSKGRMEFGARALGNRSIIARADDPRMLRRINDKIKRRDFWMPFAPMILAECWDAYVVDPKHVTSPYMTIAFNSTDLAKDHLAAALHPADDTMRPQMVKRETAPDLHALMTAVRNECGLGGLLNTSLNLHGDPICCTPEQSLRTFLNSDLDGLILEDFLVARFQP
ncbi:MAG: carbamoyltransferase [Alphaproteobacteria bacterium]|nr:carbamoyltransferase [Alphaproteobacteria bacterium]